MRQTDSKEENISAIDIGSNTLRLLICSIDNDRLIRKATLRCVTRLGKNLQTDGNLTLESIDKSIACLKEFKKVFEQYNVRDVFAIGTSALREAKNTPEFLSKIKDTIGLDIEVISGDREAELVLVGVLHGLNQNYKTLDINKILILDVGGGSTEWIISGKNKNSSKTFTKGSLPIGAVKLFESFITKDPPNFLEIKAVRDYICSQIKAHDLENLFLGKDGSNIIFIATGGTPTTLAAMDMELAQYNGEKIHLHKISRPTLQLLFQRLINLPFYERIKIKGLEQDRADIIITGTLILVTFMEVFNFQELIVSDYGILEGLIISQKKDFLSKFF